MMAKDGPIAILAGSGQLPVHLVEHLERTDAAGQAEAPSCSQTQ